MIDKPNHDNKNTYSFFAASVLSIVWTVLVIVFFPYFIVGDGGSTTVSRTDYVVALLPLLVTSVFFILHKVGVFSFTVTTKDTASVSNIYWSPYHIFLIQVAAVGVIVFSIMAFIATITKGQPLQHVVMLITGVLGCGLSLYLFRLKPVAIIAVLLLSIFPLVYGLFLMLTGNFFGLILMVISLVYLVSLGPVLHKNRKPPEGSALDTRQR